MLRLSLFPVQSYPHGADGRPSDDGPSVNTRERAKVAVRGILHRLGVDLVRSLSDEGLLRRRARLLDRFRVGVLFDVGASTGQYALTTRSLGFTGSIVSFEPLPDAFDVLQRRAGRDGRWSAVNLALAGTAGTMTLHVSGNSQSSSLLEMLPLHAEADPASTYVTDIHVQVSTLAVELGKWSRADDNVFLKLDTQGSERDILAAAGSAIERVVGLQVELSLVPLYKGQALAEDMISYCRALGFVPMAVEPGFWDPKRDRLLQADGIFFREDT